MVILNPKKGIWILLTQHKVNICQKRLTFGIGIFPKRPSKLFQNQALDTGFQIEITYYFGVVRCFLMLETINSFKYKLRNFYVTWFH